VTSGSTSARLRRVRWVLVAAGVLFAACGPEPAPNFEVLRPLAPFNCQRVFEPLGEPAQRVLFVGERVVLKARFVIELRCPQGPVQPDLVAAELRDDEAALVATSTSIDTRLFEVGTTRRYETTLELEFDVPATTRLSLRVSAEPAIGVVVLPFVVVPLRQRAWERLPDGVDGLVEGPLGSAPTVVTTTGVLLPPGEVQRAEVLAATSSDVWLFTDDKRIRYRPDAGRSEWASPRAVAASPLGSSVVVSDAEGLALITEDGARQLVAPGASPFDVLHFATEQTVTLLRGGQLVRVDLREPGRLPPFGLQEQALSSREGLWFRRGNVLTLVDAAGRRTAIDFPFLMTRVLSDPRREQVPAGAFVDAVARHFMVVPRRVDGGLELEVVQVPAGTSPAWATSTRLFAISNAPASTAVWQALREP
jgi:hypothetical protein